MAIEASEAGPARRRAGRFRSRLRLPARPASEAGQASVSFVAVVPLLLLLGVGALQAALAGHASIAASHAARAAARAEYAGEDAERAAERAVPASMRRSLEVRSSGGVAEVSLEAPRVVPFVPAIAVGSRVRLGPEGG